MSNKGDNTSKPKDILEEVKKILDYENRTYNDKRKEKNK